MKKFKKSQSDNYIPGSHRPSNSHHSCRHFRWAHNGHHSDKTYSCTQWNLFFIWLRQHFFKALKKIKFYRYIELKLRLHSAFNKKKLIMNRLHIKFIFFLFFIFIILFSFRHTYMYLYIIGLWFIYFFKEKQIFSRYF